jgi:peptidoglycan/xylan/chitin deacetylase (PgdA/CDA1 family)
MLKRPIQAGLILAFLLGAGCTPVPAAPATATTTVEATTTTTPPPTESPTPAPTPIRTPPALPAGFQTDALNPKDTPHAYIGDTCAYLRDKWSPSKAAPGTIVMAVMFHSVTQGEVTNDNQISIDQFHQLMKSLKAHGFDAINTSQLAAFLEHNAAIPTRSVVLIADDRHAAEYFTTLFRPYYKKYGWPVVNAWISTPLSTEQLWQENADLEKAGWVDHEAHGVVHNIPAGPGSSDTFLLGELQGSIDAFKEHFDKTPIAYIWPGGGFTLRSVELAKQVGYQLGFTINPRGPIMFNWVPQADAKDDMRPSYIPEGPAGDPLLTLPRYWDTDALTHLETVVRIGDAAAAYAAKNKATELEYYDIVCAPTYGSLQP